MRYITVDETTKMVMTVRYGDEPVPGEIESETGEGGQIQQADGSFVYPAGPLQPTLEDKVNFLYYKAKGVI